MLISNPGARAFGAFLKEAIVVEFWVNVRLLAAPIRAVAAGSLEPIRSAMRQAQEDGDRLVDRYCPRDSGSPLTTNDPTSSPSSVASSSRS
jgi:hypothetical protein